MDCQCLHCEYFWIARTKKRSPRCPNCGSSVWDREKSIRYSFDFSKHEVGEIKTYRWPDGGEHDRPKLYRALKTYQYRKNKKFHCWGSPDGLIVQRIS